MSLVNNLKEFVLSGQELSPEQAFELYSEDLDSLCTAANEIREYFCGNIFDVCTIINAKSGRCSEDCKYCAQSAHYNTACDEYSLLSSGEAVKKAEHNADQGVLRFSLVTSGRNLNNNEIDTVCDTVAQIKSHVNIKVCGSFGLLSSEQFKKLDNVGLKRIHNNLETSKEYFNKMCTTHTFEDKVSSIKQAQTVGLQVCSGGIFGIGESTRDRISLAFSLKELDIKSVPINLLNPIKGTPFENLEPLSSDELCRIVATYRFILPKAFIRLAGGRGLLPDKGRSAFLSGANATISGDMLTTSGITVASDMKMIKELGFEVALIDE